MLEQKTWMNYNLSRGKASSRRQFRIQNRCLPAGQLFQAHKEFKRSQYRREFPPSGQMHHSWQENYNWAANKARFRPQVEPSRTPTKIHLRRRQRLREQVHMGRVSRVESQRAFRALTSSQCCHLNRNCSTRSPIRR